MNQQEILTLLSPYFPNFRGAPPQAYSSYFSVHNGELPKIHARTKASEINDKTVSILRDEIVDDDTVIYQEYKGRRILVVKAQASFRVKKLNTNLQPSLKGRAPHITNFVQLSLQGMEPPSELFLGYTDNPTATGVEGVYIVSMVNDKTTEWIYRIPDMPPSALAPLTPPPSASPTSPHAPPSGNNGPRKRTRVQPKNSDDTKQREKGDNKGVDIRTTNKR